MSAVAHCGACGAPLPAAARFCKACGAAIAPPPPPPPPPPARASSWPVAAAVLAAVALVAVAIVVLALASGGAGSGVRQQAPAATVTSAAAPGTSAGTGSAPATAPARPATTAYSGAVISAAVPGGWRALEREAHKPGYVESKWEDPADPGVTVLVDTSPATADTLEQDAAPVHEALARQSGYSQLYYGPGDLSAPASWKWTFRIEGDQRVDYFFNRCASGYAVLGSAPPARFASFQAAFRAFAESVHPTAQPGC